MPMRPAMSVVSLLVILLTTRVKAIRWIEEGTASSLHSEVLEKNWSFRQEGSGVRKGLECGSLGHCSGSSRKLMNNAMAISKSKSSSEMGTDGAQSKHHPNEEAGQSKKGIYVVAAPPVSKEPQTYPDILDIAGMDYSHAKRRPPIHN